MCITVLDAEVWEQIVEGILPFESCDEESNDCPVGSDGLLAMVCIPCLV